MNGFTIEAHPEDIKKPRGWSFRAVVLGVLDQRY
jgi:hypothetical protein